ncbi:pseudouridine synthase [Patescibacteria group bacterium]
MKERLQKYLSRCGVASRRKSEELIEAGLVKINGKIIKKLGTKVDPTKDRIEFKGQTISPKDFVYYILYKPKGYTSTVKDSHAEKTVLELIKKPLKIYPVGRLDKNSEGLLLLTNDGEFAQIVSHPSYSCEKEYEVVIRGTISENRIKRLKEGVKIDNKITAPCEIKILETDGHNTKLKIILQEGRKRQIRRMLAKFNYEVLSLKRVRIDKLELKNLKEGEYRELRPQEVITLKSKQCSKS